MPRGLPDFYNPDYGVAGSSRDLNPLILATLGFNSVDGFGRVLFVDDFQSSINHWNANHNGGASDPVLSNDYADHGLTSLKCDSGAAAALDVSYVRRDFMIQECHRVGIEFSAYVSGMPQEIEVTFSKRFGQVAYDCMVYIDRDNTLIGIYTPSGGVTVFTDALLTNYYAWVQIKVVVDFDTGKYSHLIVGQEKYDLSQYDLYTWNTGADDNRFMIEMAAYSDGLFANPCYFGHVILTVDEP